MDTITLKNMGFYGYHGNLPSEQAQGQRFFVDVTVATDLAKPGETDDLADTINYVQIYESVARIVQGEPKHLLEHVATCIADTLFSEYTGIVGISVTVRKPAVPIPGILDYVEVTITRGQMQ